MKPSLSNQIFGHVTQRESLARLFTKDRLPSTLLFSGPEGIGKQLVAKELARTLLCKNPVIYGGCGNCSSCSLIESSNHPDFFTVASSDKEIWGTEGIKSLLHSLSLTSFAGTGRVIIFDDAEDLHTASANALLKSLEEPRPRTWFIIVTSNASKLPSTIRSRSQSWFFNALSEEDTDKAVTQLNLKFNDGEFTKADLRILASGSPGSTSRFLKYGELWLVIKKLLHDVYDGDVHEAAKGAPKLSKDKEALPLVLVFMRAVARDAMLRAGDSLKNDQRWATCVMNSVSAERLIFERNLSAQTTLLTLLMNLAPNRHSNKAPRGNLLDEIALP